MSVRFSNHVRIINQRSSPRNSPRPSLNTGPKRTRSTTDRTKVTKNKHTHGKKRKTKVNVAKKSKRASQKKRGRKMSRRQKGGEQYDFSNLDKITISDLEHIIKEISEYDKVVGNTNLDEVINNYIANYKTNITQALDNDFFKYLQSKMKFYSPLLRAINNVLKNGNTYNTTIKDFNEENIKILIRKIKEITTKLELQINEVLRSCQANAANDLKTYHMTFKDKQQKSFILNYPCGKDIRKTILDVEQPFVLKLGLKQENFDLSPIIFKRRCGAYIKTNEGGCATVK